MIVLITEEHLKKDRSLTSSCVGKYAIVNNVNPVTYVVFSGENSKEDAKSFQLFLNLRNAAQPYLKEEIRKCA